MEWLWWLSGLPDDDETEDSPFLRTPHCPFILKCVSVKTDACLLLCRSGWFVMGGVSLISAVHLWTVPVPFLESIIKISLISLEFNCDLVQRLFSKRHTLTYIDWADGVIVNSRLQNQKSLGNIALFILCIQSLETKLQLGRVTGRVSPS